MANLGQVRGRGGAPSGVVSPFMGLLPRALWRRQKDYFIYSAQFLPIALNATATFETAIQSDSDFAVIAVTGVVSAADDQTVIASPIMTVRFVDTGSGRDIFDRAQHWQNFFGTAQLPHFIEFPKVIRASSSIQTVLTNLDTANARNVRVAFHGFKIFGYPES